MMLKSFFFLCIFIPLLNATPLKPGAAENHKALLRDHFRVKRTIPDCDSSYVDSGGCSNWAANGFCQNSMYQAFMNENCKDACGICKAAPPPYSTPEIISFNVSECLAANNLNRSNHGAPDLQWDASLASESADWALILANKTTVQLEHSNANGQYGENLYYSATSAIGTLASCKKAVESWYSEIRDYDFDNPGFSSGTGHFTQVVWKATTDVGVGIAAATKNGYTYTFVVARYTPAGNINTAAQFSANVLSPSKK